MRQLIRVTCFRCPLCVARRRSTSDWLVRRIHRETKSDRAFLGRPLAGPPVTESLSIAADDRDGLIGHWQQSVPVQQTSTIDSRCFENRQD